MDENIGITERGDAALNLEWIDWVKEGKPAILISKDPYSVFLNLVNEELPTNRIIVHSNITGFGGSKIEPNVPEMDDAIEGYKKLTKLLGNRSVLRIDPIIPTPKGKQRAYEVLEKANPKEGDRVRISFIDLYPHVKERFKKAGIKIPYWNSFHADLSLRLETYKTLCSKTEATIEVCGEPGFECLGCVSLYDCISLKVEAKDRFAKQRSACSCIGQKQELLNSKKRCHHGCLYCYWKD